MKTTVDLPDPLFWQIKRLAALKGLTFEEFVEGALRQATAGNRRGRGRRVALPLVRSKQPGTLRLTNIDIENQLK